jgi:hypothetical protein
MQWRAASVNRQPAFPGERLWPWLSRLHTPAWQADSLPLSFCRAEETITFSSIHAMRTRSHASSNARRSHRYASRCLPGKSTLCFLFRSTRTASRFLPSHCLVRSPAVIRAYPTLLLLMLGSKFDSSSTGLWRSAANTDERETGPEMRTDPGNPFTAES